MMSSITRGSVLSLFINRDGFERTQIWMSSALPMTSGWQSGQAFIGRIDTRFSIIYQAIQRNNLAQESYVALANIQMMGCRTDLHNPCSGNDFNCGDGNCINRNYVCDGVKDCINGADESSSLSTCSNYKFRCDFENGLCEWGGIRKDSWKIEQGQTFLTSGPTRDHTKGEFLSR